MGRWNGYVGKVLRVELTNKKISKEPLNEGIAKHFLGGVGYGAKLLWDELKPGIDPLGPENKLIVTTGPLTGTLFPGSSAALVCFKSPLTNVWGESKVGGGLGPELKYAGFDIVILEGQSKELVYLWVHDGDAELRSATHLAGKLVPETHNVLKKDLDEPKAEVACIGPAGEKLVRFANIMCDYDRAAGRCGPGAVMGSKNVKAVVVRGHGEITAAKPDAFQAASEEAFKTVLTHPWTTGPHAVWTHGVVGWTPDIDEAGDFPTKYGKSNTWGKSRRLFEEYIKNYYVTKKACFGCVLGCGQVSQVKSGKYKTPIYGGPGYEVMGMFSGFVLNENVEAVIRSSYTCNVYGVDAITCGHLVGFAMECYEKGWITKKDTDGIELTWGDADAIVAMVEKIVKREGFGNVLAEGVKRAAEKIGKGAPEVALHVKGLEMPMHDPRGGKSLAVQYGTAPRGMCHFHPFEVHDFETTYFSKEAPYPFTGYGLEPYGMPPIDHIPSPYEENGKSIIVKLMSDYGLAFDILSICKFYAYAGITLKHLAAATSAVIGWDINDADLLETSERVLNLQRCFNIREGMGRKDDMIPKRIQQMPAYGPYAKPEIAISNYEVMLDEYYETRGWDKATGKPTRKKLVELGLKDAAKAISAP